ncbi:uncharacterized protein [Centroberyx affinis]|uniref:uncharacterized protein n=1 Tax=Centroberyx affinis TaxID=166261 RepID=UPI003A5C3457
MQEPETGVVSSPAVGFIPGTLEVGVLRGLQHPLLAGCCASLIYKQQAEGKTHRASAEDSYSNTSAPHGPAPPMAKFRSATFLALGILQQLASSSAGLQELTARPGQDVTLKCRGPNDVPIIALEWTRPDLEQPEYVFFYRDERSDPTYQNPSFEDRVELLDREMKNGDMSLILKNVSGDDSGTYECRCLTGGTSRRKRANLQTEPSSIISLSVEEQVQEEVLLQFAADTMAAHARASPAGDGYVGVVVGLVVVAVVACMVAAVLLMHRKCRDRDGRMGTKKQMDKNSDPTPADEACAQLV